MLARHSFNAIVKASTYEKTMLNQQLGLLDYAGLEGAVKHNLLDFVCHLDFRLTRIFSPWTFAGSKISLDQTWALDFSMTKIFEE